MNAVIERLRARIQARKQREDRERRTAERRTLRDRAVQAIIEAGNARGRLYREAGGRPVVTPRSIQWRGE